MNTNNFLRFICFTTMIACETSAHFPASVDGIHLGDDVCAMRAIEFTTELGKEPVVSIPREVAAKLPKSGQARIIVLTPDDPEDALWRAGAYEQFVREDSPEDAVYDSY